jgi:CheY-specific phosphatase CheX
MNETAATHALPPEVFDAFASSAVTALSELMQVEGFRADPSAVAAVPGEESIVATMVLVRPTPGRLTLFLPEATARRLAVAYLPTGTELTDEIIADVACELANVIAGQAKTILKETPHHFSLSIPSVNRYERGLIHGGDRIFLNTDTGRLILAFELPP